MNRKSKGAIPRREYARTGRMLSVIGFGGIVVQDLPQDQANRVVADAVGQGVNYFDVSPNYGDAELKLGPALEPFRDQAFLACKTSKRTAEAAQADLDESLRRLRTDHLDLYQLHALTDMAKDVDVAFGAGGAIEVLDRARKQGRVRHVGFSAHNEQAALAAMDRYDFDSVLFPINYACWLRGGFGPSVVAAAREKGLATLALKALAQGKWDKDDPLRPQYRRCWYRPITDPRLAGLALRFTLGQPITAAVSPGEEAMLSLALDLCVQLDPLTPAELDELKALAEEVELIMP